MPDDTDNSQYTSVSEADNASGPKLVNVMLKVRKRKPKPGGFA